jgi:hypothetical protein
MLRRIELHVGGKLRSQASGLPDWSDLDRTELGGMLRGDFNRLVEIGALYVGCTACEACDE